MMIHIEKETDKDFPVSYEKIIKDIVEAAISYVKCPYDVEVSVILTDNAEIQSVNREFRNIDRPTDVLSFPNVDFSVPEDFSNVEAHSEDYFNLESGALLLGDIMISVEKVIAQAEEYGHSLERELAFLTAHSMLHLCGHDHMADEERMIMEAKQEEILQMKGYTRNKEV